MMGIFKYRRRWNKIWIASSCENTRTTRNDDIKKIPSWRSVAKSYFAQEETK